MKQAKILVDLGYGDSGKGALVDYLVSRRGFTLVVRHNGGPNAAHNVVRPDGKHFGFCQIGSGMFHSEASTLIGRQFCFNPIAADKEAAEFEERFKKPVHYRIFVDRYALITTPVHRNVNHIRECLRGSARHGSVGVGLGETRLFSSLFSSVALRVRDFCEDSQVSETQAKMSWMVHYYIDEMRKLIESWQEKEGREVEESVNRAFVEIRDGWENFFQQLYASMSKFKTLHTFEVNRLLAQHDNVVFEPGQGVLLDENVGFHPYTTWSRTTPDNAHEIIKNYQDSISGSAKVNVEVIGLARAFTTRHGAGPLVTEDPTMLNHLVRNESHNGNHPYQGMFRIGHFDSVALRYAIACSRKVDALAISHIDWLVNHREAGNPYYACTEYHGPANVRKILSEGVPSDVTDLDRQECLMKSLRDEMTPHYTILPFRSIKSLSGDYGLFFSKLLGVPVRWLSCGPTENDRIEL